MFDEHGSFLEERIDPDSGLLDKLLANKTLSKIEYDKIKGHHLFYERNARLLDYISQKKKYDSLIGALRDSRQTHLVNYLIENGAQKSEYGGDWPLTDNEISILDTNRESLVDLVDCSELLTSLYSAQVINGRQLETISSEPTNHRRNEVLLDIIRRRSINDYRQVVRCLHESNQSHVAEILDKGGVVVRVHADLGNDKDADHTEDDIITRFKDILSGKSLDEASRILEDIDLTVIAAKKGHSVVLYVYCRTATELTDLYEMNLSGKLRSTVEQLFKELLFGSSTSEHPEVTVENLKDVVESAFKQLFYRSQMERLTVTLPTEEYKKCRSYFSDECSIIRAVCDLDERNISKEEYKELKNIVLSAKVEGDPYPEMLSFKKGDYMMTTTHENIGDKSVWWKVEHLSDGRIGYIPRNRVVIDYSQEAASRNVGLLKIPTTSVMTAASSSATVNFLPLELLDVILQKSYLHYALNRYRFKDESEGCLITRLATVDHCWFERLRKRRFKRIFCRRLSYAFNTIHRVIFILRSNQSFLMETIQLHKGFIDQLRLSNCLSDVQSRLLKRQVVISGKRKQIGRNNSSDLLHVIRKCDDKMRSDCFRCFRQSDQKLVTKVLDNEGVAIKVNLCGRNAGHLQQLSERLNEFHYKAKLRSDTKERTRSQLIDSGIEILHSHMDRQAAVLCIWCKSQTGLENLRILYESKSIVDVIDDLTKNTSSAPEPIGSKMIDVDIDQFKKTVNVRPIVVKLIACVDVIPHTVRGVTMLRQEVCVLCWHNSASPPAICAFQNRNPFRLNSKIEIGEFVKDPKDIGSSDGENCFFVIDSEEKCVWKIARQTGDHQKYLDLQFIHFIQWPSTMSVSCDGQELLILALRSLYIYGAFGPEVVAQKPHLVVQLPSDVVEPCHAVGTSSGHFIIIHSLAKDVDETAGPKKEKKQMFVVSKVTRDGRLVVRRFLPQNMTQELNYPRYLALDSDDRVFVADEENNRVVFLDSDLSWIRILCPIEDEVKAIWTPHRLCYDKVERQLVVAGLLRRAVNVYRIDRK